MFKHSTKVPRLYKTAANIAKDVKEGAGSIKNLVYEQKKHPNIKAIYALVTTLFQRHDVLETLLKRTQFFTKETRADPWLSKILIVEILWGKKRLPGNSIPEKTVQAYEQIFKAHMSDFYSSKENGNEGDVKPRYVRINTLFISLDDAIEGFRNEGWNLSKFFEKTDYKGFLKKITSLGEDEFLIDIHVQNLLIFPPKTEFYRHSAYKNGSIILQDKASCFPVQILNPPAGSTVLDMCAAPGMKTTQLAAVMNNQGTIYAVERDQKRFETLNKIVEASGADCIKTVNRDVINCGDADFPGVQYIIVDPSCSGSGLTDRFEIHVEQDRMRIEKLAGFQIKILRNALTRYPDAKRVVYSTCSIYPEENEDVVRQVLETNTAFKLVPAKQFVNDVWQNFGSSDYGDIGKYCLYARPNEDLTNGFFVAVFDRLEDGESNQFFNTKIYNFKKHIQSQENRKRRNQETNPGHYNQDAYDNKNKKKNKKSQRNVDEEIRDMNEKKKEPNLSKEENQDNTIEYGTFADDIVKENNKTAVAEKKKKKRTAVSEGIGTETCEEVISGKAENWEHYDEVFTKTGSKSSKKSEKRKLKVQKEDLKNIEKMNDQTDAVPKKKKKKELNGELTEQYDNNTVEEIKKKKKKKKSQDESVDSDSEINVESVTHKKKEKVIEIMDAGGEKYNEVEEKENNGEVADNDIFSSKTKKKKNKDLYSDLNDMELTVNNDVEYKIENKKKKFKRQENKVEKEDNDKSANFDIKVKNKKKESLKCKENKDIEEYNDGQSIINKINNCGIKKRKKKGSK